MNLRALHGELTGRSPLIIDKEVRFALHLIVELMTGVLTERISGRSNDRLLNRAISSTLTCGWDCDSEFRIVVCLSTSFEYDYAWQVRGDYSRCHNRRRLNTPYAMNDWLTLEESSRFAGCFFSNFTKTGSNSMHIFIACDVISYNIMCSDLDEIFHRNY